MGDSLIPLMYMANLVSTKLIYHHKLFCIYIYALKASKWAFMDVLYSTSTKCYMNTPIEMSGRRVCRYTITINGNSWTNAQKKNTRTGYYSNYLLNLITIILNAKYSRPQCRSIINTKCVTFTIYVSNLMKISFI